MLQRHLNHSPSAIPFPKQKCSGLIEAGGLEAHPTVKKLSRAAVLQHHFKHSPSDIRHPISVRASWRAHGIVSTACRLPVVRSLFMAPPWKAALPGRPDAGTGGETGIGYRVSDGGTGGGTGGG